MPLTLLKFNIRNAFSDSPEKFIEALEWLTERERQAVLRYKFDQDRQLALGSQLLRRYYFAHYLGFDWSCLRFKAATAGKPFLDSPAYHGEFNLSHHGDWVILGATDDTCCHVGVDVVQVDSREDASAFINSLRPQLAPQEIEMIYREQEKPLHVFYALWALKESYTKAIGVGLSLDPSHLAFSNSQRHAKPWIELLHHNDNDLHWGFHLSWLDQQSMAVVCCGHESKTLSKDLEAFCLQTQPIGSSFDPSLSSVFTLVTLDDIKNAAAVP